MSADEPLAARGAALECVNSTSKYWVRRAHPEDMERVAQVAADTFSLACPPSTSEADIKGHIAQELSVNDFARDLAATGVAIYVAFEGDDAIGYGMLWGDKTPPVDIEGRRPVELKRIYVQERHHGQGVADLLMDACIRHARTHGYDTVWLGTNQANDRALAFYERMGFSEIGTREFRVNNSVECDFVMARVLDQI